MVNIMLHYEGKLSFACGDYMGGQVTQLGELDSDFISVTYLHKLLREDLGYKNFEGLWCKFEGEPFESGINSLDSDADVIRILKRLEKDKLVTLHVYVEHSLDLLDIIPADALQLLLCGEPSQQPTTTYLTVVEGGAQGSEGEGGAQGRRELEGDGKERENERGREGDGNGQGMEREVEGDREGEDEDSEGKDEDSDGSEDEDSDGSEDECLSNFSGIDDDEPKLFGDFVAVDGEVVAGEGEDDAQGIREQEGNWQERENERGREGGGNGQGREGEVEGDKEREESDGKDDDDDDCSEDDDGEDDDSDSSEDEVGEDDDSDSSEDEDGEDDDSDGSEDEHISNFSEGEVEGDRKREKSDGEDDDSDGSEDEHLSNFFETDYDELGLFGDFVSVDGEAVEDELSGLDGHVDEASDQMDDQDHDVRATPTAHEDVHGESSTAHEARVPQNPYKLTEQYYDVQCGTYGVVGHNAKSCRKPTNPNRPINPKKLSNEKNKDTQGNNAKVGLSTRNKANAETTKMKPSKRNTNDNRVLVLCHNARSCHKPANSNRPINPEKPSNKKNKETQGNDAKAGPSTRNKSNAGTIPSKKNKNDTRVLVLCRNARSCHKPTNSNRPTNPKKPSNKKNKEIQGNNIEVGPSIGNELNAGTTKKKPSKKNKNDNRVLVLCHNARSCHKPANPNPPTNPKKPSNKKNKEAQGNNAEVGPSIGNESNTGTTKKKPSKKNKNDNRGGNTEAGPSIRNKSEPGATKKMPGKGPEQKGACNDIGGNENKDIAKHYEKNFKQWLHENSLFDHQRKNLNPQFLQILRDVLRRIDYLHQVENRCHGNLSELNIVIVNGRGKITRMLKDVSKKYVNDYLSLVAIVRRCFCSQRQTIPIELELLLRYISKKKPNRLLNIEHHPIFLSPLQRLSYRVIAYTFLYFGEKKKSFQLKLNEKLPKYNWKPKVRTFSMVLNCGKSFKCLPEEQTKSLQYHNSATSFMRFGRNIVVHLADIVNQNLGGKKLTAKEVDEELNGYWPKFMPILHQVLVDHGYLMVVHDAYVFVQTQYQPIHFFKF